MERVWIGLEDLGQRPKENSNEDSEGISLVLYILQWAVLHEASACTLGQVK